MDIKELAQGKLILWGANWSLYTAKIRSYLIKKGIPHIEICPLHPHFEAYVQPIIGHFTVPVLEYPNGDIIADSTDIIYQLEKQFPEIANDNEKVLELRNKIKVIYNGWDADDFSNFVICKNEKFVIK